MRALKTKQRVNILYRVVLDNVLVQRDMISAQTTVLLFIALERLRKYCMSSRLVCSRAYHNMDSVHHVHAFGVYRGALVHLCIIPDLLICIPKYLPEHVTLCIYLCLVSLPCPSYKESSRSCSLCPRKPWCWERTGTSCRSSRSLSSGESGNMSCDRPGADGKQVNVNEQIGQSTISCFFEIEFSD